MHVYCIVATMIMIGSQKFNWDSTQLQKITSKLPESLSPLLNHLTREKEKEREREREREG